MAKWNQFTEEHLSKLTRTIKRRRVDWFIEALRLGPSDKVLDLGSEDGSYLGSFYPYPENIWLADIASSERSMQKGVAQYNLGGYYVISESGKLPFNGNEIDAVWCNSVIEHVTVSFEERGILNDVEFQEIARKHQSFFAEEVNRISKKFFVQTPYKHFPIEAHAWLPFVQYLPQPARHKLSKMTDAVWVKQWGADFLLYDKRRFSHDFQMAEIDFERLLNFPKALIAIKK